ncbi:hypothetical protein BDV96DRAFT_599700 [Lophiotrema nucula]|uniref:General transcription factor TFIIB n=1 Tax=Lophiotrema nucula TaxID=690887 RepID=A0A6A5Z780_9PLEO|nr:hypothetical protein BDV96DRAFT_599700 [Lophiotrema nucula]
MCPDCCEMPPNIMDDWVAGCTVCISCGRVLADQLIETRPEWRTFKHDDGFDQDDPSRVGQAEDLLLNGSQLSTVIASGTGPSKWDGLAKAHRNATADERNNRLSEAYGHISALCDAANVPRLAADTAKMLYKKVSPTLKGRSRKAIEASCILIACRTHDISRSVTEVAELANIRRKELASTSKTVMELAKQKHGNGSSLDLALSSLNKRTTAPQLVHRACSKLNFQTTKVAMLAEQLAQRVTNNSIAGGSWPTSVAGACIYLASHHLSQPRSLAQVKDVVGNTEKTILKVTQKIRESLGELI